MNFSMIAIGLGIIVVAVILFFIFSGDKDDER